MMEKRYLEKFALALAQGLSYSRRHNLITTGFYLIDEVPLCKLGSDRTICNTFNNLLYVLCSTFKLRMMLRMEP